MAVDLERMRRAANVTGRYDKQLTRLRRMGQQTDCVDGAVTGVLGNMRHANRVSLAVYGDPQSGKTEMMICLTAKLLDEGNKTIVHLMNDNVDLLTQNLGRFKDSGISPLPMSLAELSAAATTDPSTELVVFCKKNATNLTNLTQLLADREAIIVIDDEADYATPNGKVNLAGNVKTRINELVGQIIGEDGSYIGVTATPARLDLNRTFDNDSEMWVRFASHNAYTGPDTFFPRDRNVSYRLNLIDGTGATHDIRDAVLRFLVTSAYLNATGTREGHYSLLVHTSGLKEKHQEDRDVIDAVGRVLRSPSEPDFADMVDALAHWCSELYPNEDANALIEYVVANAPLIQTVVLNSERDRKALGDNPTNPRSPFTIIIGGNIVSRGVTFPNLLAMLFTRDVVNKLQQDTYIQRARMFGARGAYLQHFELTIPRALYGDWHRCFVFHRLAFQSIESEDRSPVWVSDSRIAITAAASIDRSTVSVDAGEMGFQTFDWHDDLDTTVANFSGMAAVHALRDILGSSAVPAFLIAFVNEMIDYRGGSVAVHRSRDISNWGADTDKANIARRRGFMGNTQIRPDLHPQAPHHFMIIRDGSRKARLFYKYLGDAEFTRVN